MIQVSRDFKETYKIVSQYFEDFFPNDDGQLFIFNKEHTRLESVVSWGDISDEDQIIFYPNECWSIRLGKPYLIKGSDDKLPCTHIPESSKHGSLCVPMMSQGEIIGLLFIKFKDWTLKLNPEEEDHLLSLKQSLAVTIVEHLTLALINLHLQESLRFQSIQDRLTGLYNRRFLDESLKREAANIKRYKYSVGIIMIDVDFFKKFNDTFGHDCDDAGIRKTAANKYQRGRYCLPLRR